MKSLVFLCLAVVSCIFAAGPVKPDVFDFKIFTTGVAITKALSQSQDSLDQFVGQMWHHAAYQKERTDVILTVDSGNYYLSTIKNSTGATLVMYDLFSGKNLGCRPQDDKYEEWSIGDQPTSVENMVIRQRPMYKFDYADIGAVIYRDYTSSQYMGLELTGLFSMEFFNFSQEDYPESVFDYYCPETLPEHHYSQVQHLL